MNREGYWNTGKGSELPSPKPSNQEWAGKERFLLALDVIQAKNQPIAYRGSSRCRICDQQNGSTEYQVNGWQWPSGYRHYIDEHNVRPTLAFQEMVERRELP